jgi:hypothetical protein
VHICSIIFARHETPSQLEQKGSGDHRTGLLLSHGPWDGRGALGWGSGSVWHHPVLAAPPFRDTHFGPPPRPIPPAGGPEAGRLHSHGPWDGRGALGWGSGSVWHNPVLPPHPSWTPTSALRLSPYRLPVPEVLRRAGCTYTAHGTVGGPLVGAQGAFGTTLF